MPSDDSDATSTSLLSRSIDLNDSHGLLDELSQLVAEMHLHGLNCRYLVSVFELVHSATMRTLLLTEAVARVIKHLLEEKYLLLFSCFFSSYSLRWRRLKAHEDSAFLTEMSTMFRLIFPHFSNSSSDGFWKKFIASSLFRRFPPGKRPEDRTFRFHRILVIAIVPDTSRSSGLRHGAWF